jgi:hypothetical protein
LYASRKIEKREGFNFIFLEGKSMSLLKFFLLFGCVFEAMFKIKVNLGFHKYVDGGPILDVPVG